jgi:hypothetical protein
MSPERPVLADVVNGHIDTAARLAWKSMPGDIAPDLPAFRASIRYGPIHVPTDPLHPDIRPDIRPGMVSETIGMTAEFESGGHVSYFDPHSGLTMITPDLLSYSDTEIALTVYHAAGVYTDLKPVTKTPDDYSPELALRVQTALAELFPADAGMTTDRTRVVTMGKIMSLYADAGGHMYRVIEFVPQSVHRLEVQYPGITQMSNTLFPLAFELMTALQTHYRGNDKRLAAALAAGNPEVPETYLLENPLFSDRFIRICRETGGRWRPVLRALHAPDFFEGGAVMDRQTGRSGSGAELMSLLIAAYRDTVYRSGLAGQMRPRASN